MLFALALLVPFFTHLALSDAQAAALAHSPDVAIARAKVAEARANFRAAKATGIPALYGNYALAPQGAGTDTTVSQRLTTFGAQISLDELISASPLAAQTHAELQSAQFDYVDAQRTAQVDLIAAFYGDLAARAAVDAATVGLTDARAQQRAATLRFSAGDAPKLDVVRADVAVASAEANLAHAQAAAVNADAALALQIGAGLDALATTDRRVTLPALLPYNADAAVRQALLARPEIAAARADVRAEEHAVEAARRGTAPNVTVQGGYTKGVDSGVAVSGPSANVTVTVPLGGAAQDRVLAEQARLTQAELQQQRLERQIELEVGGAVRTLDAQGRALTAAAAAAREAKIEYDATVVGYRNGASSSLDVESARATYVAALVAQDAAYYDVEQALSTLDFLTGTSHA